MASTTIDPQQTEHKPISPLRTPNKFEFCDSPPSPAEWDEVRRDLESEFQFLASHWIEPWGQHLVPRDGWTGPVSYFVVRDADEEVMSAIPFAHQVKAGFRFRSLGGPYIPQRGLPVARRGINATVEQLAECLTKLHEGKALRFAPIPARDPAIGPLIDRLQTRGWRVRSTHLGYRQIITLPKTFEEYQADKQGSRWKSIGKRERKAAREHDVRIKLYTTEECEDWAPVIRDLGTVEGSSWLPDKGGDTRFVSDAHVRFWTDVFNAGRPGLAARIWVLYFDDEPVAFDFNIDSGDCRYSISGHYVQEVHAYSAGSILMKHMVRDAIDRGIHKIDLGTGNSGYKTFWGAEMADQIVEWTAFPPSARGFAMYHAVATARVAQGLITRLKGARARLANRTQQPTI